VIFFFVCQQLKSHFLKYVLYRIISYTVSSVNCCYVVFSQLDFGILLWSFNLTVSTDPSFMTCHTLHTHLIYIDTHTHTHRQVSPTIVHFTQRCFTIAVLPKPTVVQYYVADFSFWTLNFLCNSVSSVSLSALFFWNQLTALSEGCLCVCVCVCVYIYTHTHTHTHTHTYIKW
jgi:hypothetical protein